jgi:pimeloyl-ACP methyl ester carboxylesterase
MGSFLRSFDGTNIFYRYHRGENPLTLVFLHGVGGNWTVWRKELQYFQRHGYSTIAVDLRGHGKSDAPEEFKCYQLPYFARDIYELLKAEQIDKFILIGHSLGGAIAINYCMIHKRRYPKSIILIESASTYPFDHNRLLNMNPYVTHLLRFIANHKPTQEKHFFHIKDVDLSETGIKAELHLISHLVHLTPLRTIIKTLDNVERYVFKNQKQIDETLKHLRIPTLLIAGQCDRTVPPKFSERIKELDKQAELRIMKDAHHKIIIRHAHEVNVTINEFLKKISLSTTSS